MLKVKRSTRHCENVILNKELQGITIKRAGGYGDALKDYEEALKGNIKALKDDKGATGCVKRWYGRQYRATRKS